MRKKILNAKPHLEPFLKSGQEYYIGFGSKSLTGEGIHYPDLTALIKGSIPELTIMGRKGILKENIIGKFVRKQPETKEQILKHIKYNRKDGTLIEYDRIFEMYEKVILHKFQLKLYRCQSQQSEIILHFERMKYEPENEIHLLKAKAAINIALLFSDYYVLFHTNFDPILKITEKLKQKILSRGNGNLHEKLVLIKDEYFGEGQPTDNTGNSYRFSVLQQYNITNIFIGEGGFDEYLLFEFSDDNIVILENLRSGNATYIFEFSKYDKKIALNKTTAKDHPSFIKRLVHHNIEKWGQVLSNILGKRTK